MRFLFIILFTVSYSVAVFAQKTDTTKIVADTSSLGSKLVLPVSIQLSDTAVVTNIPSTAADTLLNKSVHNTLATDSIAGNNATDTTKVESYTLRRIVPTEPLNPNYIYSTLVPTMALMKKDMLAKTDTIVMLNGDKILANVKKFTVKDLFYGFPDDQKMEQVDRRYVQKIIYKYGRVETISMLQVDVREVGGWREVKVIKKRNAALSKMIELGEVEGVNEGTREKHVDARDLERSATITIQKKAALLGATVVLIISREVRRPYGDPPYVKLTGMAYRPK